MDDELLELAKQQTKIMVQLLEVNTKLMEAVIAYIRKHE